MKLIQQGAESRIFIDNFLGKEVLVKERFQKKYRIPELDETLTKQRIKAECRNILSCKQAGIRTPAIYFVDLPARKIYMEYFEDAISVKEFIYKHENNGEHSDNNPLITLATKIGESIAMMHNKGTIHGDLTTSNMLLNGVEGSKFNEFILIDFGLSSAKNSAENKGVDLYVLERALLSTHANSENIFQAILLGYESKCNSYREVFNKLEEVRARGRKRSMVG